MNRVRRNTKSLSWSHRKGFFSGQEMLTCYGLPENVYLTTQIQLRRLEKSKRMFKVREAIQKKCTVHV